MKQSYLIVGTVSFLLILGLYFFIGAREEIVNYPPKSGPVIAFGDSLVQGVGANVNENFVSLLSEKMGEPILNRGVSGNTTRDGLTRIDSVLTEEPRIVLLLLGGNDYIRRIPKEETFNNLRELILKIQESGAVVVLLGVRGGLLVDGFDTEFENLAEETGSVYVEDVLDGIFGKQALMADGIHPNSAGYALIAEKVYREIESVLK